ncbi:MAG: TonB-dependent receptor plug domain-containing protein, partial [Flavobacteriales bacterium]|nr:TonB-dependent receptor plug domain-containing protein [Flavobacteriales bacterium]
MGLSFPRNEESVNPLNETQMFKTTFLHTLYFTCLTLLCFSLSAQTPLSGTVVEKTSNSILPGVTVQIVCDGKSVKAIAADLNGHFEIEVGGYEMCNLEFSFVGFLTESFSISEIRSPLKVRLKDKTQALGLAVVSGSISERAVEEEVVPIEVLKPYLADNTNAVGLKGLVAKTSGVAIMDSQVSIRGGSGYSYGVGSRVSLLLDGLPLLSGDLGEIWWSYLPMEHIAQVEVIKCAAFSLYGTGASNGVIHFRSVWPSSKKET